MKWEIESIIPYGNVRVIKNGEELKNVVGVKFYADITNSFPTINVIFGDTNKKANDNITGNSVLNSMTNSSLNLKIEANGTIDTTYIFINGIKQELVQMVKLNANMYKESKLEISQITV